MKATDDCSTGFHGLEVPLRSFPGAKASRVLHGSSQIIGEHRHDWACITLPVIGSGKELWDGGEAEMSGAGVLMHPPGVYHADQIGDRGLETVSIQFDPRWLSRFGFDFRPKASLWRTAAPYGQRLVQAWSQAEVSDADLARSTAAFLHGVLATEPASPPPWLKHVRKALEGAEPVGTASLAAQLDLSAVWLARAYRASVGEGLRDTVRRRRVEKAVSLLRGSDLPLAQVAADCGFSDQSHMTRDLRRIIGRTPLQVRRERHPFLGDM